MPHLGMSLLGQVSITLDTRPIHGFESDKVRALFIYLAMHAGQPMRREYLSGLLWPDYTEKSAQQNLRKALHRLRQAIGPTETDATTSRPFLIITPQTIAFNGQSDFEIDAVRFEVLVAETRAHVHRHVESCAFCADRLAQAADLYRGDFLAGFSVKGSPEFDHWMAAQRERLRLDMLDALGALTVYNERRGNWTVAAAHARRQLQIEPWLESAHRQLMGILARDGNHVGALAQYGLCREVLQKELGVEPEPETTALYVQIRQQRASRNAHAVDGSGAADGAPLRNFPARLTRFVGREHELKLIGGLLRDPQTRLITLVGAGGSGKTRLAIEAAVIDAYTFDDGACFVPLATIASGELIPSAIVSALGLPPQVAHSPKWQVLQHLHQREMLLVTDNLEHLLDRDDAAAATFVSELLQACRRVVVLATSRERLRLYGEHEVVVPPLPVPRMDGHVLVESATLLQWPSVELFVQRARAAGAPLRLEPHNRADLDAIAQICSRLDGLPLAIELAAVRSNLLTPSDMLAQLQSRLAFLTDGPRDLPIRQQTMDQTITWSHALLTDLEQRLFRRLAVFTGGFTLAAVEAVCNADGVFGTRTLAFLAALADKSLIYRTSEDRASDIGAESRFDMLETLREFALRQLANAHGADDLKTLHLSYFCALVEADSIALRQQHLPRLLNRFDAEYANLRAALAWAHEHHKFDAGLRLVAAMTLFWRRRGHIHEGLDWSARMLMGEAQAQGTDKATLATHAAAQLGAAEMERIVGRDSEALRLASSSLETYRQLGNRAGTGYALAMLGALTHYAGARDKATKMLVESETLLRTTDERIGLGYTLLWLGDVRLRVHDLAWAERCFAEALSIFRAAEDPVFLSWALGGLGDIARLNGDFSSARATLSEALELHLEAGNQYGMPFPVEALAIVATAQGRDTRAALLWGIAERMRQAVDMPVPPSYQTDYDQHVRVLIERLGLATFNRLKLEGRVMPASQAMDFALHGDD